MQTLVQLQLLAPELYLIPAACELMFNVCTLAVMPGSPIDLDSMRSELGPPVLRQCLLGLGPAVLSAIEYGWGDEGQQQGGPVYVMSTSRGLQELPASAAADAGSIESSRQRAIGGFGLAIGALLRQTVCPTELLYTQAMQMDVPAMASEAGRILLEQPVVVSTALEAALRSIAEDVNHRRETPAMMQASCACVVAMMITAPHDAGVRAAAAADPKRTGLQLWSLATTGLKGCVRFAEANGSLGDWDTILMLRGFLHLGVSMLKALLAAFGVSGVAVEKSDVVALLVGHLCLS
ncbi:hypothetical protein OEZ85_003439 [Tetradesmus obliquus]|uniref:Uncharacterized protein n=1 Tax=Tetradesmus obliquus TaxID=3088 RepID=A0ABY8UBK3_TETOB|nr:hypothetical protein OEZ85_003439 [Tetradesmus obliquus]